jgi:hypothetical protein
MANVSGGSYAELRNAAQPTTRELAEQIMCAKAIPAGDDYSRELIQMRSQALPEPGEEDDRAGRGRGRRRGRLKPGGLPAIGPGG